MFLACLSLKVSIVQAQISLQLPFRNNSSLFLIGISGDHTSETSREKKIGEHL